jgi:hypothetical protein
VLDDDRVSRRDEVQVTGTDQLGVVWVDHAESTGAQPTPVWAWAATLWIAATLGIGRQQLEADAQAAPHDGGLAYARLVDLDGELFARCSHSHPSFMRRGASSRLTM